MSESYRPTPWLQRLVQGLLAVGLIVGAAWAVVAFRRIAGDGVLIGPVDGVVASDRRGLAVLGVPDSFRGRSGELRFRTLTAAEANAIPGFVARLGEPALHKPGVHFVNSEGDSSFAYVVMRPFGEKRGEWLNGYRLGEWPAERWLMSRTYLSPDGFIEVTPSTQELRLSARFTLGDFVTHDQAAVWPKYLVVEEKLIDKLELVFQELERRGISAARVVVLSGFRAPYYNDRGVGEGMARASRHMFGDAADLVIDSDNDGRMDDLNGDHRVTLEDTSPIVQAVAAVEARYPELRGGLGTYVATGPRGPFVHIDVRGTGARWESGWWRRGTSQDP